MQKKKIIIVTQYNEGNFIPLEETPLIMLLFKLASQFANFHSSYT